MYRCAGVELYGEPYRTLDEMLALVDAIDDGDRSPTSARDVLRARAHRPSCRLGPGRRSDAISTPTRHFTTEH